MPDNVTEAKMPPLLGGHLALDFANTVEGREGKRADDRLTSYGDLVRWGIHAGTIPDDQALTLRRHADHQPRQASNALEEAIAFRESLYRVFQAIAHGHQPDSTSLDIVSTRYQRAIASSRLIQKGEAHQCDWAWRDDVTALDRPLWPIALAAVDLLRSEQVERVKQCANLEGCGWLFLDTSKNGSRRWCSMAVCGSRLKMRRQYAKRRAAVSP